MMSRFFVTGGIEFMFIMRNVKFSRAKLRKIGVEMGEKGLYIKFFHVLLQFFKKKLCGYVKFR